ncbi:MBL fold metallo-hydrolase [Brevibacillus choshinensis]|uniref:MBL fold metallo-hydrolase n=1 Tax=Brevibacillus choshinensis TaxID=54911 RepID=UPI002E22FC40|nr:MBL fold metallo-hydrolase [Brevibacillus choshinensis]
MHIQRLQWAGTLIRTKNATLAIDPMYGSYSTFFGQPKELFYPLAEFGSVDVVAVTHMHSDHFDPEAIKEAWGDEVQVFVPYEGVSRAEAAGLKKVKGMSFGEVAQIEDMKITAVFSADGLGDPQVAWLIEAEGKRLIHCGDTLWHGHWWNIAREYGTVDVAFLPVNGAVIEASNGQPICMSPEQAVAAASILGVSALVPIHYGSFHHPPTYMQTPDVLSRLHTSAAQIGVTVSVLQHKEGFSL